MMENLEKLEEKYVIAIGAAAVDEYYSAEHWPQEGSKELVKYQTDMIGGMIPNAACVFAGYGVRTYILDTLKAGSAKTDLMLEDFKAYGLKTDLIRYDENIPDARTVIVRTPKEKTILVVDPEKPEIELSRSELDFFARAACVYTSPIEFKRIRNWQQLAAELKQHQVKLVFDIEASTVDNCSREMIYQGDILFFNEFGFEKIKGERTKEEAFSEMFDSGVQIVTVTMGERGSCTVTRDEVWRVDAMKDCQIVDTTGAGDTFNSSFVTYLLLGKSLKETAEFANAAGGYSITRLGPKGGVNDLASIEKIAQKYYS